MDNTSNAQARANAQTEAQKPGPMRPGAVDDGHYGYQFAATWAHIVIIVALIDIVMFRRVMLGGSLLDSFQETIAQGQRVALTAAVALVVGLAAYFIGARIPRLRASAYIAAALLFAGGTTYFLYTDYHRFVPPGTLTARLVQLHAGVAGATGLPGPDPARLQEARRITAPPDPAQLLDEVRFAANQRDRERGLRQSAEIDALRIDRVLLPAVLASAANIADARTRIATYETKLKAFAEENIAGRAVHRTELEAVRLDDAQMELLLTNLDQISKQRTGIKERHVAAEMRATAMMREILALAAAQEGKISVQGGLPVFEDVKAEAAYNALLDRFAVVSKQRTASVFIPR